MVYKSGGMIVICTDSGTAILESIAARLRWCAESWTLPKLYCGSVLQHGSISGSSKSMGHWSYYDHSRRSSSGCRYMHISSGVLTQWHHIMKSFYSGKAFVHYILPGGLQVCYHHSRKLKIQNL